MPVPCPVNERERLEALRALAILDTAPEDAFDRVTRLASRIFATPIALVSLVDSDRQWFKSAVGLGARQTPREHAFCAHAILDDAVMVVPDASKDARFADNPLVTGHPDIRFYAGAPLVVEEGVRLGTLCVIDTVPRSLPEPDAAALQDFAAMVVDELSLRARVRDEQRNREEIERQADALKYANRSLEQFAAMAAHDLRSPLTAMVNLADLACLHATDDRTRASLELIRGSAMHLQGIVEGYRRLASTQPGESQPARISELVRAAVGALAQPVEVELTRDAVLWGDVALLEQLLTNLLANAIRHGCGPRVRVDVEHAHAELTLAVSNEVLHDMHVDQGVFVPFRRLSSEGEGTGLGLAMVERIARLHGGRVSASCAGRRFEIVVCLPHHAGARAC